jgi:translocation and assembly module TamB
MGRVALAAGSGLVEMSGDAGADKLAFAIVLKALPASIANVLVDHLGLEGTLDGRIAVRGTPAAPDADAQITWRKATMAAMRTQNLPAHDINLKARLTGGVASGVVEVRGADGMLVTIDGSVATDERGTLKARIRGNLPLAAGNGALAARAARLGGRANLMAEVSGTVTSPVVAGTLRFADVTVDDPATGLKLRQGSGLARFTESQIAIETFEAASEQGGMLSASGEIARDNAGAAGIQLALGLTGFKFDDRQLLAGEVEGAIEVRGTPSDLNASGTVHIRRLDITVPNHLPRSIAELELKHVNAPAHIRQRETPHADREGGEAMRVGLNLQIAAANRIFVRGRGLDAQLGGDLRLKGTAARPVAVGGFAMERGRLSILGRQLDFKRGNIQFNGSLEPVLDMEASGAAGNVTVIVSVTGTASKPEFRFSSVPELPEDEVVARFLFNKELAGLSPLQLAQLASEIDKIGGLSSGPSMLDKLKSSVGIDVLDVGTDETGAATVSAGSYVNEKTYIGVRGGTSMDSSRVVIEHDLTKSLKARGEVGADNSKIGIGVEWDY